MFTNNEQIIGLNLFALALVVAISMLFNLGGLAYLIDVLVVLVCGVAGFVLMRKR